MKLYNLFESVILESLDKTRLITEGVSSDEVSKSIDGKYNVNILYRDPGQTTPSRRYIQVYVYGKMSNGNDAIRAYQIQGGSASNEPHNWKIFRLDRIEGWYPTNMKWSKPISSYDPSIGNYNDNGDMKGNFIKGQKVETFSTIYKQVKINNTPVDPTLGNTEKEI